VAYMYSEAYRHLVQKQHEIKATALPPQAAAPGYLGTATAAPRAPGQPVLPPVTRARYCPL
jgi:hypothetical protein